MQIAESGGKAFRKYKGVRIFRENEMLGGSDFVINRDGLVKNCKPKYKAWFGWQGGPRCESIAELKVDIDNYIAECKKRGIPETEAVQELNNHNGKVT